MEDPHQNVHKTPETNVSHLVETLQDMRDALVQTSLALQDYLFHLDSVKRSAAAAHF